MKKISSFIAEVKVSADDPRFFQRVYTELAKENKTELVKQKNPLLRAIMEEYNDLSRRADRARLQNASSIRNVIRTREIAKNLISEAGQFEEEKLREAIACLKENLYHLGPERQYDSEKQEHLLECLNQLQESKELQRLVKTVQKPTGHRIAEDVIRKTMQLSDKESVTDAHARQAALSAWLCFLRQSVGSCFATAPAILVHDEQPAQFFRDIHELFGSGQLKRTFGGVEYSVPFSPSWGSGDLKRQLVVQCEENEEMAELWLSPGLMEAFQELGIVDSSAPLSARLKQMKEKIVALIQKTCGKEGQLLISAEEIIKQIAPESGEKVLQRAKDAFKAIADNALLKSWEFTIASFAETKPNFTRWNLYASLGLRHEEPGGIGEGLYQQVVEKVEQQNRIVEELNHQYEDMYPYIRHLETRLRTASTEDERRFLKIDYQAKAHEFQNLEQMRNDAHALAKWYSNLYNMFIECYDELFPKYFQEIYDADMHDVGDNPYDDSPAGFRLIYKYGRTNSALWSRIYTPAEYIDALVSFFNAAEREMVHFPEFQGRERELSDVVTAIVRHVQTPLFLESAFDRMALAHGGRPVKNPLENLNKIEKKPWVYRSGGSLSHLVNCYWKRQGELTEESRWVENETELFVFLVDVIKKQSSQIVDLYDENVEKSLLIHSPTHAFLLKAGYKEFKQAWKSKEFTYTWIRDKIILPRDRYIDQIKLDPEKMRYLVEGLANRLPSHYRHYFNRVFANMWGTTNPALFRREIEKGMEREAGLQFRGMPVLPLDEVDSFLYEKLPLSNSSDLDSRIHDIVKELPGIDMAHLQELIDAVKKTMSGNKLLGAKQLVEIAAAIVLVLLGKTSSSFDYYQLIVNAARKQGYVIPKPVIVADTNWVRGKFAFVVNPGNGVLELWCVDPTGLTGTPMMNWKQWLDGSRRDRKWGVYTQPFEYVSAEPKPFLSI